jgi:DDE superfamily endonuclease/homeodomain-containing protein
MPGKAARVLITERQQDVLQQLTHATTTSKRLSQRAQLILLAFQGLHNEDIATRINLERHQVGIWRRRWANAFERLTVVECTQTKADLRRAIADVLDDDERCGAPPKFTPEQLVLIIATACEPPEQSGRPITHWTQRELADEVCRRGIVESISPTQIGRILNEADLQPHRCRYWLNTKEKDPETFAQQTQTVCATYQQAPERYQRDGTHTVCIDEKTGMQALERIAPDLPMVPGLQSRLEFEYERHGTLCLTAGFHVVTGQVLSPTMEATRTEADLVRHMDRTIAASADGSWIFVMDNLNTHCSEGLVRWVSKLLGLEVDLGVKGRRGILRSMSSRRAFLEDASHRIRFVYTPKHSSWLNQIEIWFGILVRKLLRRLSVSSVEELRSRVLAFIEYFNRTMAKPFRWTYTGRPLRA